MAAAERLHGELATWDGEYSLQVESKADVSAGTPFRIVVHEHHTVAPGKCFFKAAYTVAACNSATESHKPAAAFEHLVSFLKIGVCYRSSNR